MKRRSVAWSPKAVRQLDQACEYYEAQRPGLDLVFARSAEGVSNLVSHTPHAGASVEEALDLGEVARFPLRPFPVDLVYLVRDEVVLVLALAPHKRRPGSWRDDD